MVMLPAMAWQMMMRSNGFYAPGLQIGDEHSETILDYRKQAREMNRYPAGDSWCHAGKNRDGLIRQLIKK